MTNDTITLIGLLAGSLTTIAFIPQLVKVWRTQSTHDISLWMFGIFCVGVVLWLVYGILIESLPVILANALTVLFSGLILVLKIKFEYIDKK